MGISVGYAHVSKAMQALDLDYRKNGISGWPIRDSETMMTVLTAAYHYEIQSGRRAQPSFQYIVHPSGGASKSMPGRKQCVRAWLQNSSQILVFPTGGDR
jgi:carbohydrate-selective porin OprB